MHGARLNGAIFLAVGALLAATLLYFSLRGIQWAQVVETIGHADFRLLALASGVASVALFIRALRWRVLLTAQGPVRVSTAFWATAAGYFGNNFLPTRAGELVRTYAVASQTSLGAAYVLTTALAERLADAIALVSVAGVVMVRLPAQTGWVVGAARAFAIAGFLGAVAIVVLPLAGASITRLAARLPLPPPWLEKGTTMFEHVLQGMRAFHDPSRISVFFALTVVIWSLDAIGTVVGAHAMGLQMPLSAALLLLAGLGLGSALPSTPGYVGIYQFVAVAVLTPFGFSRTSAIAYIVVAQAFQYVVIGCWGGVGLSRLRGTHREYPWTAPKFGS
jgi:glycosyltransferase 2 family protein